MYPEIEKKLKETLNDEEREHFMSHLYRLELLIAYKVKDKRVRKYMYDEAELFRQGMEDELRSMQVILREMKLILDRQWDRLNEHDRATSARSS